MTMLVISIAVLALVIWTITKKKEPRDTEDTGETFEKPPYYRKKTLLEEKEQILFHRLLEAMPSHYVMTQVRLADIVQVGKCKNRQAWFNKVSRKSVDFVICDKALVVLACIELDGKTHEQEDRQKADGAKDQALIAAEIPIIRILANKLPSVDEIKTMMGKYLHGG